MTENPHRQERDALLLLGLRAAWLHLTLTGRRGAGLSPRDRELLCLVATASPRGIDDLGLSTGAAGMGITPQAARRRAAQLVDQDLLTHSGDGFDLPSADLRWISRQRASLSEGPKR